MCLKGLLSYRNPGSTAFAVIASLPDTRKINLQNFHKSPNLILAAAPIIPLLHGISLHLMALELALRSPAVLLLVAHGILLPHSRAPLAVHAVLLWESRNLLAVVLLVVFSLVVVVAVSMISVVSPVVVIVVMFFMIFL